MALQQLLGVSTLKGKSGDVAVSSLEGKTLMLYFSAHWCGPCRGFTPKLSAFYKTMKAKRDDFEVVFVSGDRSESEFTGYFGEHPWLAIPYSEKKSMSKLNKKFKVQGIPSLVIVDKDGELITDSGVEKVSMNTDGTGFPWKPRTLYEILAAAKMTAKDGSVITVDDLKKRDAIALYFSAHWCPPCKAFTPVLVSVYKKLAAAGKNMEFIFVSSDRDPGSYTEYYNEMPWATVAYGDKNINELKSLCEVQGIPSLVTVNGANGKMINTSARGGASSDPEGAEFPWAPMQLGACNKFSAEDIVVDCLNSSMCVILNANSAPNKGTAIAEFTKAAEKFHSEINKDSDDPVRFFVVDSPEGQDLFGRVVSAVGTSVAKPGAAEILSINLQNDRAKATMTGEISATLVFDHAVAFKTSQD